MPIKWKQFKKTHGARYQQYSNRVVIITSESGLVLTPATIEMLGNPKRVLLLHDGNGQMGLRPVTEKDPEYDTAFTVAAPGGSGRALRKADPQKATAGVATSAVACKGFLKAYDIAPRKVFSTISIENDIMVIDITKFEILKVHN